jgi:hypothetical protein
MRAKIVKLKYSGYAVRRWSLLYCAYVYADIDSLNSGDDICWWTAIYPEYYSVKNLAKLEEMVENYKKPPKVEKPREIVIKKIKL